MPLAFNDFGGHQQRSINSERIGVVVDNNDPDKQRRVKIRIRELHKGVEDADLPWTKCDLGNGHFSSPGSGSISIPPIGTKVYARMQQGGAGYSMRITGVAYQDNDKTEELHEDYPNLHATIDPAGNKIAVNTKTNTFEYTHVSGTTIKIKENGEVEIISANKVSFHANGDMDFTGKNVKVSANGTLDLHSSGNVNVKTGSKIYLESGGSPNAIKSVTSRSRPEQRKFSDRKDY